MLSKTQKDCFVRSFLFYQKQMAVNKINIFMKKSFQVYFIKHFSTVIVKNHCIFTKKSRSVFKRFRSSRIVLRIFGSTALFVGFQKQSFCSYGGMVDTVDSKSITCKSLEVQILLGAFLLYDLSSNNCIYSR